MKAVKSLIITAADNIFSDIFLVFKGKQVLTFHVNHLITDAPHTVSCHFLNMDYETFIVYNILAGHYRPVSGKPFQWRFAGGPIVARFMLLHS